MSAMSCRNSAAGIRSGSVSAAVSTDGRRRPLRPTTTARTRPASMFRWGAVMEPAIRVSVVLLAYLSKKFDQRGVDHRRLFELRQVPRGLGREEGLPRPAARPRDADLQRRPRVPPP